MLLETTAVMLFKQLSKVILESGDSSVPENYEPISLLGNFSKLLKKFIKERLVGFSLLKEVSWLIPRTNFNRIKALRIQ